MDFHQELLNQIYLPLPGYQDRENNFKIMQQKVDDVFLDWTLYAPFEGLPSSEGSTKRVLCRAYRNSDAPKEAEGVTPVVLEIIPLSCVAASSSSYTSVKIDLDNADLVQMSIKMPQPTGAAARSDCTVEIQKYLYE